MIDVEVVYAEAGRQALYPLRLEAGANVGDAIRASGVGRDFPQLEVNRCRVGIYGRLVTPATLLRSGDRIEIYRGLIADPKEVRRKRAAK
jgi:uncharacterized protein